jgi:hypothetical protein
VYHYNTNPPSNQSSSSRTFEVLNLGTNINIEGNNSGGAPISPVQLRIQETRREAAERREAKLRAEAESLAILETARVEGHRLVEAARVEAARVAEEARIAEANRIEAVRVAEAARVAEAVRVAEAARVAQEVHMDDVRSPIPQVVDRLIEPGSECDCCGVSVPQARMMQCLPCCRYSKFMCIDCLADESLEKKCPFCRTTGTSFTNIIIMAKAFVHTSPRISAAAQSRKDAALTSGKRKRDTCATLTTTAETAIQALLEHFNSGYDAHGTLEDPSQKIGVNAFLEGGIETTKSTLKTLHGDIGSAASKMMKHLRTITRDSTKAAMINYKRVCYDVRVDVRNGEANSAAQAAIEREIAQNAVREHRRNPNRERRE